MLKRACECAVLEEVTERNAGSGWSRATLKRACDAKEALRGAMTGKPGRLWISEQLCRGATPKVLRKGDTGAVRKKGERFN